LLAFSTNVPFALAGDLPAVKARGRLLHLGINYANFVRDDGAGFDAELMKMFANYLGVDYEYVPTTWNDAISDLTGEKYHVTEGRVISKSGPAPKGDILASGLTILPVRQEMVDFSCPTFPTKIWVVASSDSPAGPIRPSGNIDQDILAVRNLLRNRKVMVKQNTCLDPSLYGLENTGATLVSFSGEVDAMIPAVINGEAEFSLIDMPTALIALEKWPGSIKIIGPLSPLQVMGSAFAKDTPLLRRAFNEFFRQLLMDGTYLKLIDKYFPSLSRYYPETLKEVIAHAQDIEFK
jgi:ABC-type amino acid transport substrate-binding protein